MARNYTTNTANYIEVTSINWSNGGNAPYTWSTWSYPTAVGSVIYDVINFSGTGSFIGWNGNGTNIRVQVSTQGGGLLGSFIAANTWYHLCGAMTGVSGTGGATFYVNGVSVGTYNGFESNSNPNLFIGIDGTIARPFAGNIADVALWQGICLTAGEVAALAVGARPNMIRPSSLKTWLPLDGLASPEPDLSGSKTNGVITGSVPAAPGPPIMMLTPRWPQALAAAAAASTIVFRRTLSQVGTRVGSRQERAT